MSARMGVSIARPQRHGVNTAQPRTKGDTGRVGSSPLLAPRTVTGVSSAIAQLLCEAREARREALACSHAALQLVRTRRESSAQQRCARWRTQPEGVVPLEGQAVVHRMLRERGQQALHLRVAGTRPHFPREVVGE